MRHGGRGEIPGNAPGDDGEAVDEDRCIRAVDIPGGDKRHPKIMYIVHKEVEGRQT